MTARCFMTCSKGHPMSWNEARQCWVCYVCEEAAKWRLAHPDAATRQHWAYAMGIFDHGCGVARHDPPFLPGSEAARCWLSGWDTAERDAIAESHREKLMAEMAYA